MEKMMFEKSHKDDGVVAFHLGMVVFPERNGPQPKVGDEYEVEITYDARPRKKYFLVKLVNLISTEKSRLEEIEYRNGRFNNALMALSPIHWLVYPRTTALKYAGDDSLDLKLMVNRYSQITRLLKKFGIDRPPTNHPVMTDYLHFKEGVDLDDVDEEFRKAEWEIENA